MPAHDHLNNVSLQVKQAGSALELTTNKLCARERTPVTTFSAFGAKFNPPLHFLKVHTKSPFPPSKKKKKKKVCYLTRQLPSVPCVESLEKKLFRVRCVRVELRVQRREHALLRHHGQLGAEREQTQHTRYTNACVCVCVSVCVCVRSVRQCVCLTV